MLRVTIRAPGWPRNNDYDASVAFYEAAAILEEIAVDGTVFSGSNERAVVPDETDESLGTDYFTKSLVATCTEADYDEEVVKRARGRLVQGAAVPDGLHMTTTVESIDSYEFE